MNERLEHVEKNELLDGDTQEVLNLLDSKHRETPVGEKGIFDSLMNISHEILLELRNARPDDKLVQEAYRLRKDEKVN